MTDQRPNTCVFPSPSKIPYGGFSPVRLQTEIQREPSSGKVGSSAARIRRPFRTYIPPESRSPAAATPVGGAPRSRVLRPKRHGCHLTGTIPSRGPWLAGGLCCPARSMLTMASSEPLAATQTLMHSRLGLLRLTAWYRREARGSPIYSAFLSVRAVLRTPVDQTTAFGCASSSASAFAVSAQARRPQVHAVGSHVNSVTRLQGSLDATARTIARPSPTRAFTFELSAGGSLHHAVEYHYTGNSLSRGRTCTG